MTRVLVIPDERLLDARECAERLHTSVQRWWQIARNDAGLATGRRVRGRRTYWLLSAVVAYLHAMPSERAAS